MASETYGGYVHPGAAAALAAVAFRKHTDDFHFFIDCANRLFSNGRYDRRAKKWRRWAEVSRANAIGFASITDQA